MTMQALHTIAQWFDPVSHRGKLVTHLKINKLLFTTRCQFDIRTDPLTIFIICNKYTLHSLYFRQRTELNCINLHPAAAENR